MGNTTSCCVSSSPKLRRNHARLETYRTDTDISREDTGCNLQHISDREAVDGTFVARCSSPPGASLPFRSCTGLRAQHVCGPIHSWRGKACVSACPLSFGASSFALPHPESNANTSLSGWEKGGERTRVNCCVCFNSLFC